MSVLWDVASCSLVEIDRRFRGIYCLHHRPEEEKLCFSETIDHLHKTTRHSITEDGHLHVRRCENLKYHLD
jgi:hypothetical protein